MNKLILKIAAGFLVLGLSSGAQAGLISLVNAINPVNALSPANNDVFGGGVFGSRGVKIQVTEDVNLTFTYLGKEASYTDRFFYDSTQLFKNNGVGASTLGQTAYGTASAGEYLDFYFSITNHVPATSYLTNIGNDGNANANFWASQDPFFNTKEWLNKVGIQTFLSQGYFLDGDSVLIALDDSGAGPDDNHDDLVVLIRATSVPEPGMIVLFLLGIGLVAFSARQRQQV